MNSRTLWPRILKALGSIAMMLGTLDPLEGSLLILPGSGMVALGMYLSGERPSDGPLLGLDVHPDSRWRRRDVRVERGRGHRRQERAFDVVGSSDAALSGGLAPGAGRQRSRFGPILQRQKADRARLSTGPKSLRSTRPTVATHRQSVPPLGVRPAIPLKLLPHLASLCRRRVAEVNPQLCV